MPLDSHLVVAALALALGALALPSPPLAAHWRKRRRATRRPRRVHHAQIHARSPDGTAHRAFLRWLGSPADR